MTATFGDLLDLAASPLSDTARLNDLPSSTVIACAVSLRRVTIALSRYVADPQAFPVPGEAARIRLRLCQAAASLRTAADAGAGLPGPGAAVPLPGRIAVSARALTAGLDLLALHVTTGPDGTTRPRSPWAPALALPAVRNALLADVIDLAALAGSSCVALARVPSPALPRASRDALQAAGRKLAVIPLDVPMRPDPRRSLRACRDLLHAVPASITPARQPVREPEGLAGNCQGIELTASRLRSLTWQPPASPYWPPAPAIPALRRSAYAAAIVGHICELTLSGLVERSRQLAPGSATILAHAAAAMGTSWNAWRHVASASGLLTGTSGWNLPSSASDDLADLIVRLGRIAYQNPSWTPAASQRAPLKSPGALAPGLAEMRMTLTAIHYAADALTWVACADSDAAYTAVRAETIRNAPTPEDGPLLAGISDLPRLYGLTRDAARRAASAIDLPAATAGLPSSYLAALRSATEVPSPARASGKTQHPHRPAVAEPSGGLQSAQLASLWRTSFPSRPRRATAATQPTRSEVPRPTAPAARARQLRSIT